MNSLWQVLQTLWIQLVTFHTTSVLKLSLRCSPVSWNVQNQEWKGSKGQTFAMKTSTSISPSPFWQPQISTLDVFLLLRWKSRSIKKEISQSMRALGGTGLWGQIRVALITQQQRVGADWFGVSRWFLGIARRDKTSKDRTEMMVSDRMFSNRPQRTGGWCGRAKTNKCRRRFVLAQ